MVQRENCRKYPDRGPHQFKCMKKCTIFVVVLASALLVFNSARTASRILENEINNHIRPYGHWNICVLSDDVLDSLFWSHRGAWPGLTDASKEAVFALFKAGISRFDVDVSIINYSKLELLSRSPVFWIAHPSKLKSGVPPGIQSLDSFLSQVHALGKTFDGFSGREIPSVYLEPKFEDPHMLDR